MNLELIKKAEKLMRLLPSGIYLTAPNNMTNLLCICTKQKSLLPLIRSTFLPDYTASYSRKPFCLLSQQDEHRIS